MKPVILITSYHVEKKELVDKQIRGTKGQELTVCTCDYINAVRKAGGIPLVAPSTNDDEEIGVMLELSDGVLFSGGEDIHPSYYNEAVNVSNMKIVEKRDEFEMKLARRVLEGDVPVLGICRGMQVLNVAAGGTLYQDINCHRNPDFFKWDIAHQVEIERGTRLYEIYKSEKNAVNSFHHQAVKEVPELFRISARADDGIVEGIEMEGDRFFAAVQWHPEMMYEKYEVELEIFRHFVTSAEEYKRTKKAKG